MLDGKDDPDGEALALKELATALYWLERYGEAEEAQRRGLERARQAGDRRLKARLFNNLGLSLQAQGREGEGEALFGESFELARAAGDGELEVFALANLAAAALARGEHDSAVSSLEWSLAVARRLEGRDLVAPVQVALAQVAASRGDTAAEILHYRRAARGFGDLGDAPAEAGALNALGMAYLKADIASRALAVLDAGLSLARGASLADSELPLLQSMHRPARSQGLAWPSPEHLETHIAVGEQLLAAASGRDEDLARETAAQLAEARALQQQLAQETGGRRQSGGAGPAGDRAPARRAFRPARAGLEPVGAG